MFKTVHCQRDVICGNSYVFSKVIEEPISFKVLRHALRFFEIIWRYLDLLKSNRIQFRWPLR
ncbi:hypothetical protein BWD12_11565 [Leptospira santarosai serovar Bananal]|uniref:Transposase DDE domain protein n=1 Tax=Leptospira santarosai TaxID=28183 RepID=A0AB73M3P3_9LEPT|nr:hypothetical protein [Leptospira santarosai]OLY60960.1 hypothetical protein BV917_07325 [Leptospira santarosai serovar Guaricura]OLY65134.1 hypothetical protein BWD11_05695 [Leptospira santarosai serovar Grippotyphosa]ONF78582.1 hypothetical protein BWD12_11565 [Leptospira santarosai serovar Bananal]ONF84949.1 hypothetical protein BWD13_15115 [Leptospira santarosai serovar Grippotyphosa]ONF92280.1 hypothetical protein BWD14_13735 [Leptospira santarosai]